MTKSYNPIYPIEFSKYLYHKLEICAELHTEYLTPQFCGMKIIRLTSESWFTVSFACPVIANMTLFNFYSFKLSLNTSPT